MISVGAASRVRISAVAALTVALVFGSLAILAVAGVLYAPAVYLESREPAALALVHVSAYVGIVMFVVGLLEVEYRLFNVKPVVTVGWFTVAAIMTGNSVVTFDNPDTLSGLLGVECAVLCLFSYWYFLRS